MDNKPGFNVLFEIYINYLILRINIKYISVIAIVIGKFS